MICPFCQQKIEHQFIEKLNEYFNEEYDKNIKKISELKIFYNKYTTLYISELSALIELNNEFIDNDSLKHNLNKVKEIFKDNLYNIQQKERYPSNKYELKSHIPIINAIDTVIKAANDNIDKANDLKRDNVKQKKILINDIWIYFIKVLVNASLTSYTNSEKNLRTAITNLTQQINKLKTEIGKLNEEIFELEKSKTNIKEVIVAINKTLNSFGFTNFKLIETDAFNYSIVRENGEPVRKTLSEGEKTFIAFLYFYHLIKGSFYETGTNTDRIIVIDDPVSSLDNNVLFIVTSLIKEIRNSILNNTNYKQLFLFTHNVYFFKQVTYRRKNDKRAMGKTSFWIIRKDKYTNIERKEENPISTSYQLLWNEVKRAYEGKYENKISLCNVLRRILENYLQILGGIDEEAITSEFNGNDKVICYSLFSWVHAGSHNSNNDEFYDISDVELANYLDIFKLIFVKMGHEAHYNMMMEL